MRKRLKKILLILAGLLCIAGGVMSMIPVISGLKFKNDTLRSCSVSTGGGMLGGYSSAELRTEKDGRTTLTVRSRGTHADREVTTVYEVSPDAFEPLREMAFRYRLYAASKRRYSKIQVMDGDTTSVSFSFSKGSFRISSEQNMSGKQREGFWEVEKYLRSLAVGEGVTTVEPQTAMLYLRSGYTIQFTVEDAFDGKLDEILSEEHEVSRFRENGIVMCTGEVPDLSGAEPVQEAAGSWLVYDPESGSIVLLYTDYDFGHPVYLLAWVSDGASYACPLFEEMEGEYRFYLN